VGVNRGDPTTKPKLIEADDAVSKMVDGLQSGTEDEQYALELVSWIWCKPSDAVLGFDSLAGVLYAKSRGDQENRDHQEEGQEAALLRMVHLIHCIYGNPFRPVVFDPAWRSEAAVSLASSIYEQRASTASPSSPMRSKRPGATTPTSSPTAAATARTSAGAGWWTWCSGRSSIRPNHRLHRAAASCPNR
jgi:hypothetical protein